MIVVERMRRASQPCNTFHLFRFRMVRNPMQAEEQAVSPQLKLTLTRLRMEMDVLKICLGKLK